ncbi:M28 family peptidase [Brevibacillus ruminantium]|uniref:M28 family peptidase n=1 Tax=Brevibacillus ruminantium TaxID=2950604 RepID=A0ABY4W9R9_9BACL|nr:M28 family peptidase [Brevibacillus ruminantium]USG63669.1 M28 family peptidase [Brevibacillus ruminantium]
MKTRKRVFSSLAIAWSLLLLLSNNPGLAAGEAADRERLQEHMEKLSANPRPPATESEFRAVVYIEEWLRIYGYHTTLHPFSYYVYHDPTQLSLQIGPEAGKWSPKKVEFGPNGEAEGEILDAGTDTVQDFATKAVEGKLLLISEGGMPAGEKIRYAAATNAKGVILIQSANSARLSLGGPLDMAVPVLAISQQEGMQLKERLKQGGKLTAKLKVSGGSIIKKTSYNLSAVRESNQGNAAKIALIVAHHDAQPGTPQAKDASGVAALLETARLLASLPGSLEVRFVSLGAGAEGERGLRDYLGNLTKAEKEKMSAVIYLDKLDQQSNSLAVYTYAGDRNQTADMLAKEGVALAATVPAEEERRLELFKQNSLPNAVLIEGQKTNAKESAGALTDGKEPVVQAVRIVLNMVQTMEKQ